MDQDITTTPWKGVPFYFVCLLGFSSIAPAAEVIAPSPGAVITTSPALKMVVVPDDRATQLVGARSSIDGALNVDCPFGCAGEDVFEINLSPAAIHFTPGNHEISVDLMGESGPISVTRSVSVENALPSMKLVSPIEGATYPANQAVELMSAIVDDDQPDAEWRIQWTVDGVTGLNGHYAAVSLGPGSHTASARFVDDFGASVQKTASFFVADTVPADEPTRVVISSHVESQSVNPFGQHDRLPGTSDPTRLSAYVYSPASGFQTSFDVVWVSSIDGLLGSGNGSVMVNTLSPGTHSLTAYFRDVNRQLASDTVTLTILNDSPLAAVAGVYDGQRFAVGEPIRLSAYILDDTNGEPRFMDALNNNTFWTADKLGEIGRGSLNVSLPFPEGTHTVSLHVTDYFGNHVSDSVTFTVGNPTSGPGGVVITEPVSDTLVPFTMEPMLFAAQATDRFGQDISGMINWRTSEGAFGYDGSTFQTPLFPGTHVITASVPESVSPGAYGASRVVNVTNATPHLKVNVVPSPHLSVPAPDRLTPLLYDLSAVVDDEESSPVFTPRMSWSRLQDPVPVETASSVLAVDEMINDVVIATTTDTFGKRDTVVVGANNVNPLAVTQCPSRGNNARYEWIESVGFHDPGPNPPLNDLIGGPRMPVAFMTGKNDGYVDNGYSRSELVLYPGENQIGLFPGFSSGSYFENWKIWIDWNQDGQFDVTEAVLTTASNQMINTSFVIPDEVLAGYYRLRITMVWGMAASGCATYSYGETEDFIVRVVGTAENRVTSDHADAIQYCDASGQDTTYEYIESVALGADSRTSGNNMGYADFSDGPAFAMAVGLNGVSLSPGFLFGAYPENWQIYIDYDQNGSFDAAELVFSASSATAIDNTISVPAAAKKGLTRMRVIMAYGGNPAPCDAFGWGEVEDYAVEIR